MKRLFYLVGFVCLIAMLLPACAPAPEPEPEPAPEPVFDQAAEEAAYKEMLQKWDIAFKAGDADGLADLYTDDAVRMVPDIPAWKGKDAIRAGFAKQLETGPEKYTLEVENIVEDIVISGEWAYVRGIGKATWSPKSGGEPIHTTSKFMSLNKRQPDGSWKIVWDIWNADGPVPESFST
jgi:uncharacterized protein (TIGR02246 family)